MASQMQFLYIDLRPEGKARFIGNVYITDKEIHRRRYGTMEIIYYPFIQSFQTTSRALHTVCLVKGLVTYGQYSTALQALANNRPFSSGQASALGSADYPALPKLCHLPTG